MSGEVKAASVDAAALSSKAREVRDGNDVEREFFLRNLALEYALRVQVINPMGVDDVLGAADKLLAFLKVATDKKDAP